MVAAILKIHPMNKTLILTLLACASLAVMQPAAPAFAATDSDSQTSNQTSLPTLRGVLMTGDGPLFSLASADGTARWVELGKKFDGWKLDSYDGTSGSLTLSKDGTTTQITLATAKAPAAAGNQATLADATALIDQMRFTEMIRKTIDQQREAIGKMVRGMLAQQGIKGEEADKIATQQTKLIDIMLDEMNLEGMKDDVAKAYADLFTKEEIQGMGNFYNTATGQAMLDKQPELQARMQTIMMPRMMKAIPKVQQAAMQMAQEAATPAPAATP